MSDIQAQLLLRTFWLTIANPALTKAQAKEIAAEQLAQEEQERRTAQRQQAKPRPRPRQPRTPDATDASSAPGALLSKIFGCVHDRLHAPKPAASPAPPAAPPAPTLVEKVIAAFTPAPEPPPPQYTTTSDGRSVQLIPETEFAPGMRSVVTENWRRSIEHNAEVYEFKRGGVPGRKSWLIG